MMIETPNYRYSVRVGEHTISTYIDCDQPGKNSTCTTDKPPYQDIEIDKAIPHENYDNTLKVNDIALIKLKNNVRFAGLMNVQSICLPVKPEQIIDNIALQEDSPLTMTISGWGFSENNHKMSDFLMHAQVPLLDQTQCTNQFSKLKNRFQMINFDIIDTHLVKKSFIFNFWRKH